MEGNEKEGRKMERKGEERKGREGREESREKGRTPKIKVWLQPFQHVARANAYTECFPYSVMFVTPYSFVYFP